MKKYLPYIIAIAVLAGAAAWFLFRDTPESINKREGNFAVNDVESITKIVLEDTDKKKVELTRNGRLWMVNGKYVAREELIKQLTDAISRVSSLTPVPQNAHDNVVRELMTKNVKVDVYTGDDAPAKTYWVGGPDVKGEGTYMLLQVDGKAANRPHIAYVPGYRGYLTPRYSTDAENWRTRTVFNYKPEEIASLTLEYPGSPEKSFHIQQVADSFSVAPLDAKYHIEQPNQQKYIKQYLDFYSSISIEAYDNSNPQKDTVLQTTPFAVFRITESDNSVNTVNLYYMPINKRSKAQYDMYGKELMYDVDRYYATVHNGQDFAVVQYYVFGKLLRSYKDFYFKPKDEVQKN